LPFIPLPTFTTSKHYWIQKNFETLTMYV
jgi:hypothetical protein